MNDLIFWLKNRIFRRRAILQYEEALQAQELSIPQLNSLNWEKRKAIVQYAYDNTIFYKEFYDRCGFHPNMLKCEKDWNLVPILNKEQIRQRLNDFTDPKVNKKYLTQSTTGGSTGHPLKVYFDNRFKFEILGWRAFSWWGVSPADNVGILHRRTPTTFLGKIKNRALWFPTKRAYLNATSIDDSEISNFVSTIIKDKTVWIQGYVGALERVAHYIIDNNIKISSLKLVWSTSAPLKNNVRAVMEQAFNCKIMNQYGCNEVLNIAQQCPHSNHLHINYDCVHVDILDENEQSIVDCEGEIVVTNLTSYALPLIKYKLGDRSSIITEKCTCGINLPVLKSVDGRVSDSVYTPSGLCVDGNYLNSIFDEYFDTINQFQLCQKVDYSIIVYVRIKENNDITLQVLDDIKSNLVKKVNNEVPVTIEITDYIKDDKGKIRYIISELNQNKSI